MVHVFYSSVVCYLSSQLNWPILMAPASSFTSQGSSHRILGVFGPSGKQMQVGSGLTLYDQSPRVPPGSTIVLVFQD